MAQGLHKLSARALSARILPRVSHTNIIPRPAKRPTVPSHISPVIVAPLLHRNTMATQAPKKIEWLVVVPDFPGVHEKRIEVRPQHFAGLAPFRESGQYQEGGALLNEVPGGDDPTKYSFAGSTIVVQAASREEIKEILRKDVYAKSGVWDVENAQMWPYLCAFRNQK